MKEKTIKKGLRGFASPNYDTKKAFAAQSKGGKAKVPKGFALMNAKKRSEVAALGGTRRGKSK